jgi:hypothetical protein
VDDRSNRLIYNWRMYSWSRGLLESQSFVATFDCAASELLGCKVFKGHVINPFSGFCHALELWSHSSFPRLENFNRVTGLSGRCIDSNASDEKYQIGASPGFRLLPNALLLLSRDCQFRDEYFLHLFDDNDSDRYRASEFLGAVNFGDCGRVAALACNWKEEEKSLLGVSLGSCILELDGR